MARKKLNLFIFTILFPFLLLSCSKTYMPDANDLEDFSFIIDTNSGKDNSLPRNFRDLNHFGLKMLASAQFNQKELEFVFQQFKDYKITVVDLRQETHVFLNGDSASFYRKGKNDINKGKNLEQIMDIESSFVTILSDEEYVDVDILTNEKEKTSKTMEVAVEKVFSEENVVKNLGGKYIRIPITDHEGPDRAAVLDIVSTVDDFLKSKEKHLFLVHCKGGKGRTTTFATMYDIIENAHKLSIEEIFERQKKAGGSDFLAQEKLVDHKDKVARVKFLREFYQKIKNQK